MNVIACPSMLRTRYRCGSCGILTRFGFEVIRRVREMQDAVVSSQLAFGCTEVLSETVDRVACQWYGHGRNIVQPGHKEH